MKKWLSVKDEIQLELKIQRKREVHSYSSIIYRPVSKNKDTKKSTNFYIQGGPFIRLLVFENEKKKH